MTRHVKLSDDAFAVVCGLVQPTSAVDHEQLRAPDEVWAEIRERFPLGEFQAAAAAGLVNYHTTYPDIP